ncbi:unnamed protein product, partial [Meganyctiphanes norvegica]
PSPHPSLRDSPTHMVRFCGFTNLGITPNVSPQRNVEVAINMYPKAVLPYQLDKRILYMMQNNQKAKWISFRTRTSCEYWKQNTSIGSIRTWSLYQCVNPLSLSLLLLLIP